MHFKKLIGFSMNLGLNHHIFQSKTASRATELQNIQISGKFSQISSDKDIYMLFVCLPSIYMCVVCGPLKRTCQIGKTLSTLQATAKEKDFSEIFGTLRIQQALKLIAFCIS